MSITTYFKNSLEEAELYTTDFEKVADNSKRIDLQDIKNGQIPVDVTRFLYENAHIDSGQTIDVLINPVMLFEEKDKQRREKPIAPLWLPARLNNQGVLSTIENYPPWLARNYLFPSPEGISSIGYLNDFNNFLATHHLDNQTWQAFWSYALRMFQEVTGYDFGYFEHDDYTIANDSYISVRRQSLGNKKELVIMYDELLRQKEMEWPLLYKNYISLLDRTKEPLMDEKSSISQSFRHLGQMNKIFPISPSQREALSHFFSMKQGDILAINGPPGTGKSAIMETITASLWVESALKGKQPPLILGSAIDHFTAMDMVGNFGDVKEAPNPLAGRWLPGLQSYGLYLATDINESAYSNLQIVYPNQSSHFEKKIHSPTYIAGARDVYLQSFQKYANQEASTVEEAVNILYDQLKRTTDEISATSNDYLTYHDNKIPDDWLSHLDTGLRFKAFQLATHYWEGRWLLEVSQVEGEVKEPGFRNNVSDRWHRLAKLAPCLVSTFFAAPSFFKSNGNRSLFEFGVIDLLLVEEAGQVVPEVAGPVFSLAKKALALGDTKQLEPIWNITTTLDLANMKQHNLFTNKRMMESGLAASNGSVLKVAQRRSCYQKHPSVGGMFLTEHRRSVPEIIDYNNTLAYQGWLEPKRPSLEDYPYPHIGYCNVQGKARRHSASYSNQMEAETIVNWIISQRKLLEQLYPKQDVSDIVGIVTPFTQQKQLIEDLLDKKGLNNLTAATIHMIQGAENPMMIFSPVHDMESKPPYFFDRNETLLNVTVSRAKDSFLVFGDNRLFDLTSEQPSGVLAHYLFADESNEINE